jgi:hypothetical protein
VSCGARNEAGDVSCFACGKSLKTTQPLLSVLSIPLLEGPYRRQRHNSFAIAGLVFGLLSPFYPLIFVYIMAWLSFVISLPGWIDVMLFIMVPALAIVLSSIGLYREKTIPWPAPTNDISAWLGLITGLIFLGFYVFAIWWVLSYQPFVNF